MAKTVASRILGTPDNDVLLGTPGDDVIDALAGNDDIVSAFGGNDTINAGSGDDNASAGNGDDLVLGRSGTDFLRGGAGNDTLDGGTETDTLIGDDGDDTISGGDGNDLIFGDRIDFGGTGNDLLKGGAGDDKILGAEGDDQIFGDNGKDILNGSLGNDSVYGGANNDQVFGFTGDDQVYGDDGDDLVNGGDGSDRVFGGKGNDKVFGLSAETSQPNLGKGEIDTLTGNEGNDTFVLGSILPNGTPAVFYDDGDPATAGTGDYALIADFGTGSTVGSDVIQLTGSAANYSLGSVPTGLPSGAGIFYNNGMTPELISIIAGISPSNLSLSNPNQFTFSEQSSPNPKPGEPSQKLQIEVLASGLESPRKLTFGPDGALYVAEAGRGGPGASIPSPSQPGAILSYGATGAITRIQDGTVERVVTGLPSLALPDGGDASGVHNIEFDAYGNAYAIVGFAGNPALRDSTIKVPDFSQLIAIDNFDGGSSWTRLIDFGAYELNNNPDGQDVNTNLYDLLIKDNTVYVLDAGGNNLLSQKAFGGELTLKSVFQSRTVTDPLTGKSAVQQPVPTAVTVGADGAFYVSELTGAPFQAGVAKIYRLTADGQPEVYADGFTNIVDLAFDKKSGGFYVLEYDADGISIGSDAGALIYLSPDGKTRTKITDKLVSPTGLTIGTNGDLYISNKGFIAGEGEVLRLTLQQDTPKSVNQPLFQAMANGATGRWSGWEQANLLDDTATFNYAHNLGSDLDPNVKMISQARLS
jgi:RTX calcium-binding nonapeptide repeat (4 copies)